MGFHLTWTIVNARTKGKLTHHVCHIGYCQSVDQDHGETEEPVRPQTIWQRFPQKFGELHSGRKSTITFNFYKSCIFKTQCLNNGYFILEI